MKDAKETKKQTTTVTANFSQESRGQEKPSKENMKNTLISELTDIEIYIYHDVSSLQQKKLG